MIVGNLQGGNIAYVDVRMASKVNAAADTAATIHIAGVPDGRWVLHKVYWSYSADPAGGRLSISGGLNNFDVDITRGGPGGLTMTPYVCVVGNDLDIALYAGGGVIVGKVMIDYVLEMYQ